LTLSQGFAIEEYTPHTDIAQDLTSELRCYDPSRHNIIHVMDKEVVVQLPVIFDKSLF